MITTLSDALAERGFDTLTDVQQAVTDPELAQADLLVSAQTGSGKTVGFGLAIAPTLMGDDTRLPPPAAPLALVVAPTRELAMQVSRELGWLYAKAGARITTCIGGMDARDERRALDRGAHIVVGTPGRLRDHIARGALDLTDIRAVVLDEADEMLDLGFREDLEFILGESPEDRRTLLFSATVPRSIAEMAKRYQRDAVRVTTQSKGSQHADITYQAVQVASHDAEHAIINLLRYHDAPNAIVFANTRAAVARLTARFANRGFSVVSLSGELSQDERTHAIQALRDGRAKVCVATDVAARGIDLPNLELVIHADLPGNTESLLHRSGRTGRAGRKGISALIVPDKISKKASRLLGWAKIQAEWVSAPSPDDIRAKDEERLLADPAWEAEASADEAAFAATLLEKFGAENVAVACLKLYRARLSAPEELNTRPARADRSEPRKDHTDFGPSTWISLSVGHDQRAEARWLLPLLIRSFNLEKSQIGKIRVQGTETFVEIAEAAAQHIGTRIAQDATVEDNITARMVDGVPQDTGGHRPGQGRGQERGPGKPHRKSPGDRKPREHRPRSEPKKERNVTVSELRPAKADHKSPSGTAKGDMPRKKDAPHKKAGGFKSDGASGKGEAAPKGKKPGRPKSKPPQGKAAPKKSGAGKPSGGTPPATAAAKPRFKPGAADPSKPMGRRKTNAKGGEATPRRKQ